MPRYPCQPRCSFCHQEVPFGAPHWYCNGATICEDCFPSYARGAFAPYQIQWEDRYEP